MVHGFRSQTYFIFAENLKYSKMEESLEGSMTFLVEGVLLLVVACVGLVGNIFSFTLLGMQGLQKTFHNLLFLLNIFDMVTSARRNHSFKPCQNY